MPKRPRCVVLCNFDEFRVYDFDTDLDTFPWPQFEMGSATVPVAESGVPPGSRAASFPSAKGAAAPSSQRDAENSGRAARAPQNAIVKIDAVAADARDAAVLAAYGFSAKTDLLAQLPALNLEVATQIERGSPVTAPAGRRFVSTRNNW